MAEKSVEVVKGIYEAFGRRDVSAVLAAMAVDIEWYEAERMPYGGLHRGPDAAAQNVLGPVARDIPDFAATPEELIVSGEHGGCRRPLQGHGEGHRQGAGPSGSACLGRA